MWLEIRSRSKEPQDRLRVERLRSVGKLGKPFAEAAECLMFQYQGMGITTEYISDDVEKRVEVKKREHARKEP